MNREKFQLLYLFTFMFSAAGIFGNIQLEVSTPLHCWIIAGISGFLSICKIIYWIVNDKI